MRWIAVDRLCFAFGLMLAASSAASSSVAAYDLSSVERATGVWELSRDDGARKCSIQLRAQTAGVGNELGLPPPCRHGMPVLASVSSWKLSPSGGLDLLARSGAAVLSFAAERNGLAAKGPEGETYILMTANEATRGEAKPAAHAAAASSQSAPAVRSSEIPGRYAVLREGRKDTGCMLTLETSPRGAGSRAQLAPACRDNGILVFDPQSWSYLGGKLRLTARKGHSAAFERAPDGTWQKDPKEGGQPLGFRKM